MSGMSQRDQIARAWHEGSDHADHSPFGGPLCNCWQVAGRIIPMLAEAWESGWLSSFACPPDPCWMDLDDNPYRAKEDRHVDQ